MTKFRVGDRVVVRRGHAYFSSGVILGADKHGCTVSFDGEQEASPEWWELEEVVRDDPPMATVPGDSEPFLTQAEQVATVARWLKAQEDRED